MQEHVGIRQLDLTRPEGFHFPSLERKTRFEAFMNVVVELRFLFSAMVFDCTLGFFLLIFFELVFKATRQRLVSPEGGAIIGANV